MTWTPEFNVFDDRKISSNLVAYFKTNQTEALLWANDGSDEMNIPTKVVGKQRILPIPEKNFFLSASSNVEELWPALTVVQAEFQEIRFDGLTRIQYVLLYQMEFVDGRKEFLQALLAVYRMAFQSMVQECPGSVLEAGAKDRMSFNLSTQEVEYDVLRTDGNRCYQAFQSRITWEVDMEPRAPLAP